MQRLVVELTHAPERTSELPLPIIENDVARIEGDRYSRIASRDARVRFLRSVSERAERIVLHVSLANDQTYLARFFVDGTRRILRKLGREVAEPGDRFGDDFFHRFFDEEALRDEIEEAGLMIVERRGESFFLERGAAEHEEADTFATEVARVLKRLALAERTRRDPPESAVLAMRARGRSERARGPIGRARLRRAIGWVDALFPTGPSCYRRTLLELSLDGKAARETIVFGLDVGRTGHVAFKDTEDRTFDVAYEIEG